MPKSERIREAITGPLDPDYIRRRTATGWKLTAVEWERETDERDTAPSAKFEEPPYGLRIANDCAHLEEDPGEMANLAAMMELIVQDISLPRIAEILNERGQRTRQGGPWTPVAVFNTLPRLVEASPRVLGDRNWQERRNRISTVAWNS
jgi:hypothetical protein